MNKGIDPKSILQCKTETLTLDRKDGKEKDLPGPYLAITTAGVALVRTVRMYKASRTRRTSTARRREGQGHWRHH
jgi:hypothetical protein